MAENEVVEPTAPAMLQITPQQALANLRVAMKNTGRLFFWIAGLSIANTALYFGQAHVYMLGGLGATQVVDCVTSAMDQHSIGFALDLMMACVYMALGFAAGRGSSTAFVAGMALYAADCLILLWMGDYFNIAWHFYFLYNLFGSWKVNTRLRQALVQVQGMMPPTRATL